MTAAAIIWINDGQVGEIKISDTILSSDGSAHIWAIYNGTYYPAHIMEQYPISSTGVTQLRSKLKTLERQLGELPAENRLHRCAGCSLNNLQCDIAAPTPLENSSWKFVPVKFPEITSGREKENKKVNV